MDQIWKKPEGITFEDVEELKPGEMGIVTFWPVRKLSDRELELLEHACVIADQGQTRASLEGLLPAEKKRTGQRRRG